ncbi:hypothetical protein ABK040_015189 [Willaertia magna]
MKLQAHFLEESKEAFNDFRLRKGEFQNKSILAYKADETNTLEIDTILTNLYTFNELKEELQKTNEIRYICYFIHFEPPKIESSSNDDTNNNNIIGNNMIGNEKRSKMILISWNPLPSSKDKFLSSGTCVYLRNILPGIFLTIQATSVQDLDEERIIKECLKRVVN